ncbi:MAG: response regulator transcription factor [Gemmatirosa sp.]|nr:response regulator transcription factor [Gemmatirosa sp.]
MSAPIRIVLADDHALVLDGLRALLAAAPDLCVVGTAADGAGALDAVRRLRPDVLVTDLQMAGVDGLACLRAVREARLPVRVLVLSAFGDAPALRAAIEGGADGFALKTDAPHGTLAAIRQVAAGHLAFPQAARRWLVRGAPSSGFATRDPGALTAREEQVLALLADGRSNADIAASLRLRATTVKFHLRNLFAKLGVTTRTAAAAWFHRRR